MKRKILKDFANVCCQKFLTSLSNGDRVNFVIFGSGAVSIDFLTQKCTHNKVAVSPLFYAHSFRSWLANECQKHRIEISALTEATLQVEMYVETERNIGSGIKGHLSTKIRFDCTSRIATDDKVYTSQKAEEQDMGLGEIMYDHYY